MHGKQYMYSNLKEPLQSTIDGICEAGLYKNERVIDGPQDAQAGFAVGSSLERGK